MILPGIRLRTGKRSRRRIDQRCRRNWSAGLEKAADHAVLSCLLARLDHPCRELPPILHFVKERPYLVAIGKRASKDVGGRYRILDCKIDTDPADRRHGVGGISDCQQSWPVPLDQPVELHRQEMKIRDLVQFAEVEIRRSCCFTSSRIASIPRALIGFGGALRDQESALPIIAAVDHDEQAAALDVASQRSRSLFAFATRNQKTSMGAPRSSSGRALRAIDDRPSAAMVSVARS